MRRGAAAGLLACVAAVLARGADSVLIDGVLARVNERTITLGEVREIVAETEAQLRQAFPGEAHRDEIEQKLKDAYRDALAFLIERALILDAYDDMKQKIPDAALRERVDAMVRETFGDDVAKLNKALAERRLTRDDLHERYREEVIISSVRNLEVTSKVHVSPTRVREVYEAERETRFATPEAVDLWVIALFRGRTEEERAVKRKEAERVRTRLLNGEDFEAVARDASEGSKARAGGHWGWVETGKLHPALAGVVAALAPGAVSEPVEVEDELYLVKTGARREASHVPFEDVQQALEREIRKQEEQRLYDEWMANLKSRAFIKLSGADFLSE